MEHRRTGVNGTKDPVPRVSLATSIGRSLTLKGANEARGETKYRARSCQLKFDYSTKMGLLRRQENA
jgi:hypothetical protein